MRLRQLWFLAVLGLAACGGTDRPQTSDSAVAEGAAAASDDADSTAAHPATTAAPAAVSQRFELGRQYERLAPTQPTSSGPEQVEVAEVFWYGCPHCFAFDPILKKWIASKPEYVSFIRIPAVWNDLLKLHARAFYTAEELGKGAEMHDAFFKEIHEKGNHLDSEEKLQEFFGRFGVAAADFKRTFDSLAVNSKVQHADELNRRYKISSVPTIVVNGKYVTDGTMAGSWDTLLELVSELAAAEHAGK
jgi:protein dithiol oxidoreductase (disulfide-forming)